MPILTLTATAHPEAALALASILRLKRPLLLRARTHAANSGNVQPAKMKKPSTKYPICACTNSSVSGQAYKAYRLLLVEATIGSHCPKAGG